MKLSPRVYIPVIAVVAVAGGTGAFLVANAGPVSHTVSFTADQLAQANFSSTTSGVQDKDIDKAGKVVGYDILSTAYDPQTKKATVDVAVVTNGGLLYGLMPTGASVSDGKVTGGTGIFQNATGSITAAPINNSQTLTAVTITYHT